MGKHKNVVARGLVACIIVSVGAVVGANVVAADHDKDNVKVGGIKWQYLALTHNIVDNPPSNSLGKQITTLGQEHWELVSVENFSESGTTVKTVFYFKRPI